MIAHLKLQIAKFKRDSFGQRSERAARLLDQLELQLEELEATATEDELAAEMAAPRPTQGSVVHAQAAVAQPFPEHLPRERVVIPGPCSCPCCGGKRCQAGRGHHRDAGGDPAPVEGDPERAGEVHLPGLARRSPSRRRRSIDRPRLGRAGLLAMILFEQVRQAPAAEPAERALRPRGHRSQPLDPGRSGRRLHRGAGAAGRAPRGARVWRRSASWRRHDGAGAGQRQDRGPAALWIYVRDDRPFGGQAPPAAMFYYSRDRAGEHPQAASGVLCRDPPGRCLWRIRQALRGRPKTGADHRRPRAGVHGRRQFFVLADIAETARRKAQARSTPDLAAGARGGAPDRC